MTLPGSNINQSPRHFELVGLPGAGKTTLGNRISSDYIENAYVLRSGYTEGICREVFPKFLRPVCRMAPRELVEFVGNLSGTSSFWNHRISGDFIDLSELLVDRYTDDVVRRATVKGWFHQLLVRYVTVMRILRPTESVLCDEGFLMRANAAFCPPDPSTDINTDDVSTYVSKMPTPDKVVILDVPMEVAITRITLRSPGPPRSFVGPDHPQWDRLLDRMETFIETVVSCLNEQGISYVRIDTDGPLTEVEHRIVDALG